MGTLTRTLMNSEVAGIIDRTDRTATTDTRLQWAMDVIAGMYAWQVLNTEDTSTALVTSTKSYAIPSTMKIVETVRFVHETDQRAQELRYYDPTAFADKHPYPEGQSEAQPEDWMRLGSNIVVAPIPSSDQNGEKLYLNGILRPTAFAGDSSTSDLDKVLDQAIVYLAASMEFEALQEEEQARYWKGKATEAVREAWGAEMAMGSDTVQGESYRQVTNYEYHTRR